MDVAYIDRPEDTKVSPFFLWGYQNIASPGATEEWERLPHVYKERDIREVKSYGHKAFQEYLLGLFAGGVAVSFGVDLSGGEA